jgi:hypothetical protein
MFTWQSGSCSDKFKLSDVTSKPFERYKQFDTEISGVIIDQKLKEIPLQYILAVKKTPNVNVTYNCQFYPESEKSGTDLWDDLKHDGKLDNILCK